MKDFEVIDDHGSKQHRSVPDGLQFSKNTNAPLRVLFVGHMDTVFDINHSFQNTQWLDEPSNVDIKKYISPTANENIDLNHHSKALNKVLNGPGVADLKGGLIVMYHAILALENSELSDKIDWTIAINPDEEVGSLSSAEWLEDLAKKHDIGLVFEPALPNGHLAGGRKGSGNFTAIFTGKSAHVGRDFDKGKNAIVAMSDFIQRITSLNHQKAGLTVNPGYITGGGALNSVADHCIVKFNLRFENPLDESWILKTLQEIKEQTQNSFGCHVELDGKVSRKPKILDKKHLSLYNAIKTCGNDLGIDLDWKNTGGCCDGNNLSGAGLINVDTLGAVGGNLHNDNEFIYIESLVHRAQLSALFLMKLADGKFPELTT